MERVLVNESKVAKLQLIVVPLEGWGYDRCSFIIQQITPVEIPKSTTWFHNWRNSDD